MRRKEARTGPIERTSVGGVSLCPASIASPPTCAVGATYALKLTEHGVDWGKLVTKK